MSILKEIASKVFLRMEDKMRVIAGIDTAGQPQYAGMTAPAAATGTATSDNTIMATGSTVTIGGQTYTFRTSLTASTTANEVLINGSADAGLLNWIRAINRSGTPGTDYGSDTVANADVTAATSVTAHAFLVTAKTAGAIGNLVATSASSSPNSHITWTSTVLTGGANASLNVAIDVAGGGEATAANQAAQIAAEQAILAALNARLGIGYVAQSSVTRPANTTAYTAGDVVGATAAAITFASIGPAAGFINLNDADLRIDVTAVPSGMTDFRLHLYNVTPPSALADNAPWDLPSGDRASYLGYIDLGTPVDVGSTLYVQTAGMGYKEILMGASTSLFGYLVTNGGYTPGSADVLTVRLAARGV